MVIYLIVATKDTSCEQGSHVFPEMIEIWMKPMLLTETNFGGVFFHPNNSIMKNCRG
jgi:hypothetical protein